jgi:hypothetical protein
VVGEEVQVTQLIPALLGRLLAGLQIMALVFSRSLPAPGRAALIANMSTAPYYQDTECMWGCDIIGLQYKDVYSPGSNRHYCRSCEIVFLP